MPDASSRVSPNGKPLFHYIAMFAFSNHIVVPEIALVKIREDTPFDKVCYIGCGMTTGVGAVVYSAKVEGGMNVMASGLGGNGMNLIQGAKMVGVDINPGRVELAKIFGLMHFANSKEIGNVVDHIVQLTDGEIDDSFECFRNTILMRQALECTRKKGWVSRSSSARRRPARKSAPDRSSRTRGPSGKVLSVNRGEMRPKQVGS